MKRKPQKERRENLIEQPARWCGVTREQRRWEKELVSTLYLDNLKRLKANDLK